jgi:hypothetical protein
LEPRRRLEVRALFAAVQFRIALWTVLCKICAGRQGSRAIETARRRNMLHQSRETRSGHVQGRTRTLGFWTVFAIRLVIAIRVHVPVLPVFAVAIHMGMVTPCGFGMGRLPPILKLQTPREQTYNRTHEPLGRLGRTRLTMG